MNSAHPAAPTFRAGNTCQLASFQEYGAAALHCMPGRWQLQVDGERAVLAREAQLVSAVLADGAGQRLEVSAPQLAHVQLLLRVMDRMLAEGSPDLRGLAGAGWVAADAGRLAMPPPPPPPAAKHPSVDDEMLLRG